MTGASSSNPTPEQIRRAADGELSPGEPAVDASADSAVRFERELRSAVGRVMGKTSAPAGLADRVRAAMAAAEVGDSIHLDDARDGLIETAPAAAAATTTVTTPSADAPSADAPAATADGGSINFLRWLESPRRANAAAVAAVLALVIGAIGFGIVMPSITQWGQATPERFVERAATFAANEHGRCTGDSARAGKFTEFSDVDDARDFLSRHLNRPASGIRIPDLTDRGYEFVGVSACHVPGGLPSVHVVWRSIEPNAGGHHPMVSGFVTLDRDQFELRDAAAADVRVGGVPLPDGSTCTRTVRVIRDGGLAFLIVCCDESATDVCARRLAGGMGG
jgi:hypothetical protein